LAKKQSKFWKAISKKIYNENFITPDNKSDYTVKKIGLGFTGSTFTNRDGFEGPNGFDFMQIDAAYFTDSYIRIATDKKVDFMFKSGWKFVGKNEKAVNYINQRFKAIALATDTPIDSFLLEIATSLVKYYNCFVVKTRQSKGYKYPPGITAKAIFGKTPVTGYYLLPTETITIQKDKKGKIVKYKQTIGQDSVEFKASDVIHIYMNKPPGYLFGLPSLAAALNDVAMLRQAEELVSKYLYKNIFPLLVYTVGTEAEAGTIDDEEIESVKEALGVLAMDGGVVIPGRHGVKTIKQEGLSAEKYLDYFKTRVFTALEVSSTVMGEAQTANRSTSDNLDQMFKDNIKSYQHVMSEFINYFVIFELLLEGGFDPYSDDEDVVLFKFEEIDIDSLIAYENHLLQQFTQNAITHDELRLALRRGALSEEDQDKLYYKMVKAALANNDIQNTIDSSANQTANDVAQGSSAEFMQKAFTEGSNYKKLYEETQTTIIDFYKLVKRDVIKEIKSGTSTTNSIKLTLNAGNAYMSKLGHKGILNAARIGMDDAKVKLRHTDIDNVLIEHVEYLDEAFKKLITKLIKSIENDILHQDLDIARIIAIFDAHIARAEAIARTEISRAYNLGFAWYLRSVGHTTAAVKVEDDACEICNNMKGSKINLYNTDKLPPFHTNCQCRLEVEKEID